MRSNVVALDQVRPKTLEKKYKGASYTITYVVETKQWSWRVTYVTTTVFEGDPKPTMQAANRAAEKHIDRQLELQG